MKQQGFTLIEILVAFFLLVLILGGMVGLVQSALVAQRTLLERQAALQETAFAMEYVVRAVRGAQKDLAPDCLTNTAAPACSATGAGVRGCNFEFNISPPDVIDRFRFIDRQDKCREFFTDAPGQLKERISGTRFAAGLPAAQTYALTSNDFGLWNTTVSRKGVYQGDGLNLDYVQPHITFSLRLDNNQIPPRAFVPLSTTITQRILDVQL